MSSKQKRFRVAILDDYQNVALSLADWSVLDGRATVTVFDDHLADSDAVVERLQPFDIVCVMRERTPMTRSIIERLPKLGMIASTANRNASIDLEAAEERGIQVVHTGYTSAPTIELTWALILGSARNLVAENASLRGGGWQQSVGDDIAGRTLGVLGLGNVGGAVAQIGNAFGMKVIAWSQNLTIDRAAEVGATLVSRDEVFREADVVTIHLVLSGRTRGLVGAAELALMKPTSRLINTSRGPIVVEADLIAALKDKIIAGAAIDVFDQEPLPLDHPFRALPNLLATPHIGYVSRGLYARSQQAIALSTFRQVHRKPRNWAVLSKTFLPRRRSCLANGTDNLGRPRWRSILGLRHTSAHSSWNPESSLPTCSQTRQLLSCCPLRRSDFARPSPSTRPWWRLAFCGSAFQFWQAATTLA